MSIGAGVQLNGVWSPFTWRIERERKHRGTPRSDTDAVLSLAIIGLYSVLSIRRPQGRVSTRSRSRQTRSHSFSATAFGVNVAQTTAWHKTDSRDPARGAGTRPLGATRSGWHKWRPAEALLDKAVQEYASETGLSIEASPVSIFANRQEPSDRHEWAFHAYHKARDHEVVTAVLTMRNTDCLGGDIQFSTLDDGSVDMIERDGRERIPGHVMSFTPKHSSIYVFPGSLVQHRPANVRHGMRYSVVAFYRVHSEYTQFLSVWAGKQ